MTLNELFDKVCAERSDSVAVSAGEEHLTYAQLNAASHRLAALLHARGVRHGDLVGLRVSRTLGAAVGLLGILRAGAAYVPLDPDYPAKRLRMMIEEARLRVMVGALEAAPDDIDVVPASAGSPVSSPPQDLQTLADDDPAYVIYTSGSTGRPKGCVVTHGNVVALLEAALPLLDVTEDDRWALFHSTSFDFSVWELWGALATGATAVIVPELAARSPADLLDLLVAERVTVLNQIPSVFRYLVLAHENAGRPGLDLRYVIFGGESVDLDVIRRFAPGRKPVMINMYGITETTVHVTFKIMESDDLNGEIPSPIGVPLPHLTIELRDDNARPVPEGQPGEMWIAGAGVAAGYLNHPDLTAERFTADGGRRFYRSGDLARRLPDGQFEYLGRVDRQVKLRGFRIEPAEIETVLRGHPGVRDIAVAVATSGAGLQLLAACVVPAGPASTVPEGLREHAAAALPQHMVPQRYYAVRELPRTPSGKLDRAAIDGLARHPPLMEEPDDHAS